MDLTTYLAKGYDLSDGATTFTSADLSAFSTYFLEFIWSNVAGTLDGELLIRQTNDSKLYDSIETFTLDSADETRSKNNIVLTKDKIDIKFTPNGITGGRLSIKLSAIENLLQKHESNVSAHSVMRANLAAGNLTMTGNLLFTGGGLSYGTLSVVSNANETTITLQDVYVQVTDFDTNGVSNNTTPDHTNDHITIAKTGVYKIECCITANSIGGAGATFEFEIKKNDGDSRIGSAHGDRTLAGGGGEAGAITICTIAALTKDDTVELWVKNEVNTQNIIVEDASLSVLQVGG